MNIKDCVALVVDPTHPRYDQLAEIRSHDSKEHGTVNLRFIDNGEGVNSTTAWRRTSRPSRRL